jgi:maltooligosyltrehalose trehalohydrolase
MHTFRVWAPFPKKVEVQVGQQSFPMTAEADGWWTATISSANPGDDYGFILHGDGHEGPQGPFPDPRSPSQPNGVHKLSRLVDHTRYKWQDEHWQAPPLASAIIYELHLGTFTPEGTFLSTIHKLDYLVELGITHVELMPVNSFSGSRGWGYDGVDLFAPHQAYGQPDDLKKLVDACHARGLAVLLDVVYNHLGPSGNYLGKFAPYFTKKYASPWGEGVNFDDADNGEVRRFFCDNALMWLRDYHFDGLRLDAVHAICDLSAQTFLEQLALEVKKLGAQLRRHFVLIPESDLNDPRLLWSRERGGFGLDAQWSDDFHHALHTVLTGEKTGYYSDFGTLANLAKALKQSYVYDGCYSSHRRRRHGRPPDGLDGHHFLAYLQNHDQVGNRAKGDRTSQLLSPGKLKIGAALVLTAPFIPMIFQGEEWAANTPFFYFTDYAEPELARGVREGRCREFAAFGWKPEDTTDPQAVETFDRSKLNWTELANPAHAQLLDWYKQLIQLRQQEPSLSDGCRDCVQVTCDENERWLVLERGEITVACNFGTRYRHIPLGLDRHKLILASEANIHGGNGINFPPESVAIFKQTMGEVE